MKPPSSDLFQLIRSLTPSEKRYFRQWARRHTIGEENNYLELFDAMAGQPVYDEAVLKAQFAGRSFARYFPVAKRYLFEQLTEALHHFHVRDDVSEEVKRDIHVAAILLRKDLVKPAAQRLQRSRKKIEDYGLGDLLPHWLRQQRRLYDHRLFQRTSPGTLNEWRDEWTAVLDRLAEESRYAWLSSTLGRWHYRKVSLDREKLPVELEAILAEEPSSPRARLEHLRARSTYHFMRGEAEAAYYCNQALLDLFEEHPGLLELSPRLYLTVLNNFLIDNQQLGNYKILEEGLIKLRALPERREFRRLPNLPVRIFELSTLLELNAFVARRRFAEAGAALPAVEKGLHRYGPRLGLNYRLTFYYLLAYIHFENQAFDEALSWLNELLEQPGRKEVVGELLRFGRLLQLLTHFELGHDELLPYRIQSVRRQLAGSGKVYQTEQWLLRSLSQLLQAGSRSARRSLFRKMREEVKSLKADAAEKRVFNYFDYERWVEGKV